MTNYEILGVGSPIIDHIIHVNDAFLQTIPGKKGGMETVDFDTLQDLIKSSKQTLLTTTGGSCSNTMKGLAHLGFKTALLGVIGNDPASQCYLNAIKKFGVQPLFQISPQKTSQVVCMVTPEGERTCRAFLGASLDIQVDKITPDLFQGVKLVHIEGYSLLQGSLTEHVMELAKKAYITISFDLASFELVEQFQERILNLLSKYVDIAFANEREILSLTGMTGKKGCEYLKDLSNIAIIKHGSKGCFVGKDSFLHYQPVINVPVVDSTGAGDLFASGFLGAYLKGKPLDECAIMGNLIGAATVEIEGTDLPPQKWEELKKSLEMS